MRQVPIVLRIIEAVADDEVVLDTEPDVLDLDVDLAPRRFAEKARRAQRLRSARAQNLLQIHQRQPGVDDVFDDHDVAALERGIEILQQPDLAGTGRALRVARHRHEIERNKAVYVANQIREEHERALEHGDQVQAVRKVAPDVDRELANTLTDLS